jgi:hypothetical protein
LVAAFSLLTLLRERKALTHCQRSPGGVGIGYRDRPNFLTLALRHTITVLREHPPPSPNPPALLQKSWTFVEGPLFLPALCSLAHTPLPTGPVARQPGLSKVPRRPAVLPALYMER